MSRWPSVQLRHVARFAYGDSLPAEDREDGAVPVFGSNGLVGVHSRANTAAPTIIIGRKGSHGKLEYSDCRVFAIDTTYYIDHTTTTAELRWLYYALKTARLEELSQDVGVPGLSRGSAYSRSIPLPPPEHQRAIACFLDTECARIDALIAKKRRMMELLEERKAAAILAAVGGGLTHQGRFERSSLPWLIERPEPWPEVLLRLVARTGSGHTPSRERPEWWVDCTIPWITTGEVAQVRSDEREEITDTRESISELGLANSSAELHLQGTVVLCRTASAGYSAIMGAPMATSQDFATWTCGPHLRPRFLLLCLRAMRPDLLGRLAMGSTHKTIYMPDILGVRIPLPSLDEQDVIVDRAWKSLRQIFDVMRGLRSQIELIREHRQALITAAVTGELEVPDAA